MNRKQLQVKKRYVIKGQLPRPHSRSIGAQDIYPKMVGLTVPNGYGFQQERQAALDALSATAQSLGLDMDTIVELLSRRTIEVAELDARIPFTAEVGARGKLALYHPQHEKRKKDEWHEGHVIRYRDIVQTFEDWKADIQAILDDITPRLKEVAESLKAKLAEQEKANKEAEENRRKLLEQREKAVAARTENEAKLRTILANFGINDSDGWRGINTKDRWSDELDGNVLTTYVRHLDLNDVLTLTGGRTEPVAKTAAKKAAKKEAK